MKRRVRENKAENKVKKNEGKKRYLSLFNIFLHSPTWLSVIPGLANLIISSVSWSLRKRSMINALGWVDTTSNSIFTISFDWQRIAAPSQFLQSISYTVIILISTNWLWQYVRHAWEERIERKESKERYRRNGKNKNRWIGTSEVKSAYSKL